MAIPIIGDLFNSVKDVVSEVVVDKDKRDQVNLELRRIEDQAQARLDAQLTGQIEVNKVEAGSGSVFVAGWRPAIGWVGAVGLGYSFVIQPFLEFGARVYGYTGSFPDLATGDIITLVAGMLGLGGLRAFEKVKGVATNDYTATPAAPPTTVSVDTKKGAVEVTTPSVAPAETAAPKKKRWSL